MTKKISIIGSLLVILIIIGFSVKPDKATDNGMLQVESVAIHTSSGWGYKILVDHKVFINQEYIPVVAGKKAFLTKEDAMKTAGLVVQKLVKGKLPSVTKDDLTALKISFQ
jgi:Domain of unknown function (DUF4907)